MLLTAVEPHETVARVDVDDAVLPVHAKLAAGVIAKGGGHLRTPRTGGRGEGWGRGEGGGEGAVMGVVGSGVGSKATGRREQGAPTSYLVGGVLIVSMAGASEVAVELHRRPRIGRIDGSNQVPRGLPQLLVLA